MNSRMRWRAVPSGNGPIAVRAFSAMCLGSLVSVSTHVTAEFENWAAGGRCRLVGLATRAATEFYEELGFEASSGYFKRYLRPEDRTHRSD